TGAPEAPVDRVVEGLARAGALVGAQREAFEHPAPACLAGGSDVEGTTGDRAPRRPPRSVRLHAAEPHSRPDARRLQFDTRGGWVARVARAGTGGTRPRAARSGCAGAAAGRARARARSRARPGSTRGSGSRPRSSA